MLEYFTQMISG